MKTLVLTLAMFLVFTCVSGTVMGQPTPLTWLVGPTLTTGNAQMHGSALVTIGANTFAYLVGGNTAIPPGDSRNIHYAQVNGTTVGAWTVATYQFPFNNAVYITRSTVGYNGYLYVVGGNWNFDPGGLYNGIRVFRPEASGNITAIQQEFDGAPFTPGLGLFEMAAVAADSRSSATMGVLYIVGGGLPTRVTNVQRVYLDKATGNVIGPVVDAGTLVTAVGSMQAVILNGYLYVVAGFTGTAPGLTTVQYAQILPNDNLGPFLTATAVLPEGRFDGGAAVLNNTIYVLGGCVTGNATTRNNVFRATMSGADITAWTEDTPIPLTPGVRRIGAIATPNAIFLLGGRLDGANFSDKVHIGFIPTNVMDWTDY